MDLEYKDISLNNLFKKMVGCGHKTYFWIDTWCGDLALKYLCPNFCVMKRNKDCLVLDMVNIDANAPLVMELDSRNEKCERV